MRMKGFAARARYLRLVEQPLNARAIPQPQGIKQIPLALFRVALGSDSGGKTLNKESSGFRCAKMKRQVLDEDKSFIVAGNACWETVKLRLSLETRWSPSKFSALRVAATA